MEQHNRNHPDVQQSWAQWSEEETLHVGVAYSNAFRWETRRRLANYCLRHLARSPNIRLYFVELAYGDRPWEIAVAGMPGHIQLRTTHELFHKENLQKLAVRAFAPGWKYGCVIDADFHMTREDWALETIHQLQHYDFLQPYSSYVDVSGATYGTAQLPTRVNSTFFFNYIQNGYKVSPQYFSGIVNADGKFVKMSPAIGLEYDAASSMTEGPDQGVFMRGTGATGGALAFRRSAYDAVGGLLDRCILGHGDWYMAFGLVDVEPPDIHVRGYSDDYLAYVRDWRQRAKILKKNVGYVDGMAVHYFHGSKTRRFYSSRDLILSRHKFSPWKDIYEDWQGVYQLTPNKPEFRDENRQYYITRSEDDPNLGKGEKPMV